MSMWKTYKLGDIADKIGSGATPRGGKEAYLQKGDYSLIRSQNVLDFAFSKNGLAYISEKQGTELRNVTIQEDDILLNITGDSVARVCQVPKEVLPARVNQHVAIVRGKKEVIDQSFLKYYLLEPSFKRYMLGLASSGATRNALTKVMIENFEIQAPDLPTQTQIAQILTSLDDKIELLQQMNQTLENIAQAIFKEWFVDFNFPGFDGELVDGLPKGWRIGKLGEIVNVKGGTTPSTAKEEYWNGEYYWTTPKDLSNIQAPVLIDTERKITELGVKQISSGIMPEGTLLLSSRAPIGYLAISQVPISINQGYIAIQGKSVSNLFMLFWLKQNMDAVKSKANGSTFQEVSKTNFKLIDVVAPEQAVLKQFDDTISPIFKRIVENVYQIQTLTQTRDTLLPKLMSGQVEIKN